MNKKFRVFSIDQTDDSEELVEITGEEANEILEGADLSLIESIFDHAGDLEDMLKMVQDRPMCSIVLNNMTMH